MTDMSDLEGQYAALMSEFKAAYDQFDLSSQLYEMVVDRTENYREGFYFARKINDMGRQVFREMMEKQAEMESPHDMLLMMRETIDAFKKVTEEVDKAIENLEN